jgi:hypothetical protein
MRDDNDPLYKEVNDLFQALSDESIYSWRKVEELIKEHHDPEFADKNDHYWVSPDGNYGSRKPMDFGMRSEHSRCDNLAMTVEIHYGYWPNFEVEGHRPTYTNVRVRTQDIAIRLVLALMHHNLVVRLERLRTNTRYSS